jgi:DNA-binding transcriptional LysR family regulator
MCTDSSELLLWTFNLDTEKLCFIKMRTEYVTLRVVIFTKAAGDRSWQGQAFMDLLGMEIFARVVEAKSFSRAGQRLKLSTSAISKHVNQLEKSLGVRLLNRTTRSISVTEVGAAFYERCSRIIAEATDAEASVASLHAEPRGTLKVNVPVAFGVIHIAPALAQLLHTFPQLHIEMTLSDRVVNLAEDGYDAAVVIAQEVSPLLVARKLMANFCQVCATPDYFARHGVPTSPHDLVHHNCIVCSPGVTGRGWCFNGPQGELWTPVKGNVRLDNENAIRQAALSGLGVALLPNYIVGGDIQTGALHGVLSDYTSAESAVYIVYLSNRHLPVKVRAFVDFLASRFGSPAVLR